MGLKLRKRINNQNLLERFASGVGSMNGSFDGYGQFHFDGLTNNGAPYTAFQTNTPQQRQVPYFMYTSTGSGGGGGGLLPSEAVQGVAQGVQSGFLIAANNAAANAQVRDSNELQLVAGTYEAQGSGYSYTRQNNIDEASENKRMNDINTKTTLTNTAVGIGGGAAAGLGVGAAIGSGLGPIGAGIGAVVGGLAGLFTGIFGGKSRKRKLLKAIANAQNTINRNNNFYQASALSDYLANQYQLNHTNTQDDALYTAKHGKDLRQPILKR